MRQCRVFAHPFQFSLKLESGACLMLSSLLLFSATRFQPADRPTHRREKALPVGATGEDFCTTGGYIVGASHILVARPESKRASHDTDPSGVIFRAIKTDMFTPRYRVMRAASSGGRCVQGTCMHVFCIHCPV